MFGWNLVTKKKKEKKKKPLMGKVCFQCSTVLNMTNTCLYRIMSKYLNTWYKPNPTYLLSLSHQIYSVFTLATIQIIVKNMNLLFLLSPKSDVKLNMHVPGRLNKARKQAMLITNQKDKRKAIYFSNMCKIVLWLHWKKERKGKKDKSCVMCPLFFFFLIIKNFY